MMRPFRPVLLLVGAALPLAVRARSLCSVMHPTSSAVLSMFSRPGVGPPSKLAIHARARGCDDDELDLDLVMNNGDASAVLALDDLGGSDLGLDDGTASVPRARRRKRDRADKAPNRLGKPGLKGFVPSATDPDKVRPSLDDVERISRGQRAKQRGVGSRATPHRLNADERAEWERAKRRGWLQLQGRGYRKERKGSPLLNIFRQLSDAHGRVAIWVELGAAGTPGAHPDGMPVDWVAMDVTPLRNLEAASTAIDAAAGVATPFLWEGAEPVVVDPDHVPTEEELLTRPIWNVPFHEVRFEAADRTAAKALAKTLVEVLHK
eukprot:CAMPEP_0185183982 /NCGR_PEP_ID=MMETSP1140-20130426/2301_1 /TAXON_ID=298111 /ORGANISM="Pavlova sp., Strain CCMP459" /LENGTH=320 /DNA_ID=CAMNT_0027750021 /DNA_START=8 /DNA_END=970 /DNA_ORIENTATION=+